MAKTIRQHVTCVVGHHFVRTMGDYRTACPYCRITILEKEVEEQARLNGMGAERELRLMAQVVELEKEILRLKTQLQEIMT